MKPETRVLGLKDYDALLSLWNKAGFSHRPEGRDSKSSIIAQMRRDKGLFLGAFRENRLVGSVIASYDGRKGWINRLAVDPEERRKGIAKVLIETAESVLRDRGSLIIAALVEADNSPSIALFQKCGYKVHRDILYLTKRESEQV
ncbi:MAG TPA: GNAT family N-acetyltransferase [Candidatus Bathyarchaeia archaeon]|nr:GNAT family N-acetyltransferase [Candidatus Bathyarchaeia archaeon]